MVSVSSFWATLVLSVVMFGSICRCDLKIVSDANQFYIEKILEQHDLLDCFSEIYTNPTSLDENGNLRILPYHSDALPPHSCNLCPSNLCKVLFLSIFVNYIRSPPCLPS